MNKNNVGKILIAALMLCGVAANAQVERVVGLTVSNPAGMIATIENYLAADEGDAQSVTLLQHLHDGMDPSTHTIVTIYDDLESMEDTMDVQANSAEWAATLRSTAAVAKVNGVSLALQRRTWGPDLWSEGDYLAAVLVDVQNGGEWLAAMDEWSNSSKVRRPGLVRVVRLRGGTPANHAVLIAASSYADLINYMEDVEVSAEFATLVGATTARIAGTTIYQVSKIWHP